MLRSSTKVDVSITFVETEPNDLGRYLVAVNLYITADEHHAKRSSYLEFLTTDEILDIVEDPTAYMYGGGYTDPG